jgi:hypothetical protein
MNALARKSNAAFTALDSETDGIRPPPSTPSAKSIPAEEIFRERCEVRAILYEAGELELHEAVDVLQADAERTGLVEAIGQDAVQAIMAAAFSGEQSTSSFSPEEISEARLRAALASLTPEQRDDIAFKPTLKKEATDRPAAAKSTLRAADYLLKQNDPERMRRWMDKHTAAERAAIIKHIRGKQ